jgi:hypothetical protein
MRGSLNFGTSASALAGSRLADRIWLNDDPDVQAGSLRQARSAADECYREPGAPIAADECTRLAATPRT